MLRHVIQRVQASLRRRDALGILAGAATVQAMHSRLGSLAEFRAAIREKRESETSGRNNIYSLDLTVAAIESARRRAAVDIAELR